MLSLSAAAKSEGLPTIVSPYRPFEGTAGGVVDENGAVGVTLWNRFGPSILANDHGRQHDMDFAKAIIDVLQGDDAAVQVPLSDFVVSRRAGAPRRQDDARFTDGDQVKFSVVAELKRDSDTVVLVVRLARTMPVEPAALPEPGKQGLPKWRLKRVLAHIEANIENPITLNDLAQAAGLSAVYFGAQFRLATGLPPHEFVLRRRIHRAQELLLAPNASLLEVALSVGFQTQAHFSTVFKRIAGDTPSRWRRQRMSGVAA